METAMTTLINWLDLSIDNCKNVGVLQMVEPLEAAKKRASELLDKEKQIIIDTYEKSYYSHVDDGNSDGQEVEDNARKYYNNLLK